MNFMLLVARAISHSFAALTREILFLPLEHKIHIFSPPCYILYLSFINYLFHHCYATIIYYFCYTFIFLFLHLTLEFARCPYMILEIKFVDVDVDK